MRILFRKEGERINLDKKDMKILSELCKNARAPLNKIGKSAGLSRDAVKYRINRMEEAGVIQGWKTTINTNKLGYKSFHIFISASGEKDEKALIKYLLESPITTVIIKYTGKINFEAGVKVKRLKEIDDFLMNLSGKAEIKNSDVLILFENWKNATLPEKFVLEKAKVRPKIKADEIDMKIIRLLSENGKIPIVDISTKIGLSADAVVYRMRKLIQSGVIVNFCPVINYSMLGYSMHTILVRTQNLTKEKEKKLKSFLQAYESVIWAVKTIGNWDIVLYVLAKNQDDFHNFIISLQKNFPELIKDFEALYAYQEYKYSYLPGNLSLHAIGQKTPA